MGRLHLPEAFTASPQKSRDFSASWGVAEKSPVPCHAVGPCLGVTLAPALVPDSSVVTLPDHICFLCLVDSWGFAGNASIIQNLLRMEMIVANHAPSGWMSMLLDWTQCSPSTLRNRTGH